MKNIEFIELRSLLSAYCRNEINLGYCTEDTCEFCCINEAYEKVKNSETLNSEEEK